MPLDLNLFDLAFKGILATLVMDLVGILTIKSKWIDLMGLQIVPPLLGRWFLNFCSNAKLFVPDIRMVSSAKNEKAVGWILHYLIGAILGIGFALQPFKGFEAAIIYGLFTNIFPWLLMYPAIGFGFFASRLPISKKLLGFSFINHLVYGIALGCFA